MAKKNDKKNKKKPSVSPKKKPAVKKAAPAKKAAAPKKTAKPIKKAAPIKKAPAKKAAPQKVAPKGKAPAIKKPAEKPLKGKAEKAPSEKKSKREVVEQETQLSLLEAEPAAEEQEAEEVVLTDAEGRRYCRVKDCDQVAVVDGYCRYHYLLFWKKIQVRKKILSEGKLERYIEELTARYPDKFLDMLRKDLRSEKEFLAAIQELEIDESAVDNEFEDEAQTYIDEVRGMGETGSREEEDF